jgi:hypothetical protein
MWHDNQCSSWAGLDLYECVLDALGIFSSSFRSIESLLPIGRHLTSLRSAKTTNRSAAKLIRSFLLDWRAHHSTLSMTFKTSSWPSRGRYAYTSLEGLWDMGTPGSHRPNSPPAHQKTRRPVSRPTRPDMWTRRWEDNLACKTRQSTD